MINEVDNPADRPGEYLEDAPEAVPQVDNAVASVRFADLTPEEHQAGTPMRAEDPSPKETQDEVTEEPRRRSVLSKGFSVMGLSTIARRFDRQGKGELDEAEQRARDLADSQGHVRPDQAITAMELGMANEKKLTKAVRHFRLMSVLALLLLVGIFVAVFYAPDNAVAKGNVEVKEKIDESVQTDVAVDALGDPHLTDKATGKDITVKADGVVAGTTPRVLNGRKLTCISLADVASAVHGLETASTKVNLVFRDEQGLGTKIAPLADYEDRENYLSFDAGKIRVKMDSDACDVAAALDKDDVEGVRRLGRDTALTSRPSLENENIQAKLRRAYLSARMTLREGRRLTSGIEVEVITTTGIDGSVNVDIAGTEQTSICPTQLLAQCPTFLHFKDKNDLQAAVNAFVSGGQAQADVVATYGPIGSWDVSRVTDMSDLFKSKAFFDDDISGWDTSRVTDMYRMFWRATAFNGDISNWDTSSVTTMYRMFYQARAFNQDLSSWDTSKVTQLSGMFEGASAFNQNLSSWKTKNAIDINGMFNGASAFNQDLCAWGAHHSSDDYGNMFGGTSCFDTSDPSDPSANWCACCPSTEVCDGLDNDCDGEVDEGTKFCKFSCDGNVPLCNTYGIYNLNCPSQKSPGEPCDCHAECNLLRCKSLPGDPVKKCLP